MGTLCVGFTLTTGGTALTRLVRAFTAAYPDCEVQLRETDVWDLYGSLRRDDIGVLISWLAIDEPGLAAGPAIEYRARALAVSRDHPLAARGSAGAEDLAVVLHQVDDDPVGQARHEQRGEVPERVGLVEGRREALRRMGQEGRPLDHPVLPLA